MVRPFICRLNCNLIQLICALIRELFNIVLLNS
ncbi:unnamed protein product [Schistosoma curassoni]|uniref:Uncharacterized protein n=1 Tax=Schistosoma curassoni TaxID=6186 RepID=A0A183KRT0_9TREM|nr:unnamed protein product [Schistosoma curassoni]